MKNKKIKAILSDAGGILFDDTFGKRQEYSFVAKHLPDMTYRQFKAGYQPFKERAQREQGYSKNQSLEDFLRAQGINKGSPELRQYHEQMQYINNYLIPLLVFKDVLETLQKFQEQGIPFIVLTNTSRTTQEVRTEFYDRAGLTPLITDIISSKDLGLRKPHPSFFDEALQRHHLSKDEVLWVAHDLDELQGGYEYGLTVVAFNYDQELRDNGTLDFVAKQGYFIDHFSALLGILGLK